MATGLAMVIACLPEYLGEPCEVDQDCGGTLICKDLESGRSCQLGVADSPGLDLYKPGMTKASRRGHFLLQLTMDPPPQSGISRWNIAILHRNESGGLDPVRSAELMLSQVKLDSNGQERPSATTPLAIHVEDHYYEAALVFDDPGRWQTTIQIDDGLHSDMVVFRMDVAN